MNELLNKLSEYHFVQSLVPGMIFTYCSKMFYEINFLTDKPIYDFCVILIIGLIISRIGSIIVEPLLKKIKILNFCNYSDYIKASQNDSTIEKLSETNNLYRVIIATFFILIVEKFYFILSEKIVWLADWSYLLLSVLLIVLFVFSYRKQTNFIKQRIKEALDKTE
ncbi:MAG: hypothetical protein UHW86_09915 [Spirochaetota bacterium]|nr:hypothetical protein [Spirochaetota bacterium]